MDSTIHTYVHILPVLIVLYSAYEFNETDGQHNTYLRTYSACPLSRTDSTKLSVTVPTSLTKKMDSTIHTYVHILPVHLFVKLAFVE